MREYQHGIRIGYGHAEKDSEQVQKWVVSTNIVPNQFPKV